MTSATGSRRGLALLEVLVAVVVFFGGVTAVLRAFAASASALDMAADTRRADALLCERLTEVELRQRTGEELAMDESGFDAEEGYRWQVRYVDLPGQDGLARRECSVTVWREGSRRRHTVCTWLASAPP